MMDGRLDRLYRRYCANGELRALAQLFDLAAPELLAVARHLCGDEAEAEDAVQATFVTLIAKRAQFDRQRRFAPWALGILSKHAHAERRRSEREPDPARLQREASDEPGLALERSEFDHELAAQIEALPELYVEAVRAHLLEGVGPRELGARLAISPNAASVRVHRGLRLLRRLLPPGFATGWLIARPARGLPALRAGVLREAAPPVLPSPATGISAGALTGGLLVKKLTLTALTLIVALAAWIALRDPAAPDSKAAQHVTLASPAEIPSLPPAPRPPVELRQQAAAPISAPPAAPTACRLRVHVTYERDGLPAAGVGVFVDDFSSARQTLDTDAEGVAVFEAVPPGSSRVRLGRAESVEYLELAAGADERLELVLPRAITIQGIVVDHEGGAVPGADVVLGVPAGGWQGRVVATTGADGRFELRAVHPNCRIGARARGHAPARMRMLAYPATDEVETLELSLRLTGPGGSLAGRVLDPEGRPLEHVELEIGGFQQEIAEDSDRWSEPIEVGADNSYSTPPRPLRVRTDEQGAFACAGLALGERPVRVHAPLEGFADWSGTVRVEALEPAWLEVRLAHGASAQGRITDDTGRALARISVQAWGADRLLSRTTRTDSDGRYQLEHLAPGPVTLRANARLAGGFPDQRASFEVGDGGLLEWNLTLSRAPAIVGRALDEAGQPLADWIVQATSDADRARHPESDFTDAAGRFRFTGRPDERYTLSLRPRDTEEHDIPRAWKQDVLAGGPELELIADTSAVASLRCTFVGPDGEPAGEVRLMASLQPIHGSAYDDAELDTGAVELEGLPPGRYELWANSPRFPILRLGEHLLRTGETLDLGTIRYARPARISVQVRGPDGLPPEGLAVALREPGGAALYVPFVEETAGHLRSGPTPPGTYELHVTAPGCVAAQQPVELGEGEALELQLTLESAP